ncbi:hypothetical protein FOZ62_019750, partial [Perkinsus olseni]
PSKAGILGKAVEAFNKQYCGTTLSISDGGDDKYDCIVLSSDSCDKAEEHLKKGKDVLLLGRLPESTSQLDTLARLAKEYPKSKLVATYPEDAIHSLQPISNIKSLFISFGPTVSKLQSLRIVKKVTDNDGAAVCARWTPSNSDLFCSGDASTDSGLVQIRLVKQDP